MARSMKAMLTGVAVAGLVALGAGSARAQDVTVMTSVPGLNFPFFVHMLKAMQDEGKALGVKTVELDGQNSAPKQTADVEAGGRPGRQRHRHQPDRRQRHGAGAADRGRQRRAGGDDRPPRRRA